MVVIFYHTTEREEQEGKRFGHFENLYMSEYRHDNRTLCMLQKDWHIFF